MKTVKMRCQILFVGECLAIVLKLV